MSHFIVVAKDKLGFEYHVLVDRKHYRLAKYRWRISRRGYAYRKTSIRRKGRLKPSCVHVYMHREICGLPINDPRVPDHRNRNKLDNREENLEVLDGNAANVRRALLQDGGADMAWEEPQEA